MAFKFLVAARLVDQMPVCDTEFENQLGNLRVDDDCHSDASRHAPRSSLTLKSLKSTSFLATAVLLAGSLGLAAPAQAQVFWSSDRAESAQIERKKIRRASQRPPKIPESAKEQSKPAGPVIIVISIQKQQMKIYDTNGVFAESPVSTGTASHPTPMGVFSVIGKEIFHRSNIYSGAPMPHMQRITWSGVAMHAGVLPGYPASHGCIRLPANFATRMYGWTSKGARVVIAPGELAPEDFAHRNLITKKLTLPDPNLPVTSMAAASGASVTAAETNVTAAKADKSAVTDQASASDIKLTTTGTADASSKSNEVRTADASGTMPVKIETTADAKPETAPNKNQARPIDEAKAADAKATDAKASDTKTSDALAVAVPATEQLMPGHAEFIGPVKPRTGHLAAFISRKEGKLFVRQNFQPLFDVPVTIEPGDKPLGTHVFTARADKDDADTLRWTVVSLPAPSRVARRDDNPRRKKVASTETAVMPLPSSATEALDRIAIPEAALKRIAGAIAPGGSIMVSDYGFGDETGLGTDFIVTQR